MYRRLFACIAGALLIAANASASTGTIRIPSLSGLAASPSLRAIDANLAAARAQLAPRARCRIRCSWPACRTSRSTSRAIR